jgi:uncharacterized lipoprotein
MSALQPVDLPQSKQVGWRLRRLAAAALSSKTLGVNLQPFTGKARKFMNTHSSTFSVLLAVALLSGCALTTDRIEIQYTQQQGVAQIPDASAVSVAVEVIDQRQEKGKVSSKKNGFGVELAPIVATEEVSITVRGAIEKELQARGFRLASQADVVHVSADLTRFYNDHKIGFFAGDAVADLNLSVTVRSKAGGIVYSRQIVAQGVEPNTQLSSGENARLALNRALENGIKSLFEDRSFTSALLAAQSKPSSNPM